MKCRGALRVIEIRRHRDHCVRHRFTKVLLGVVFELLDDQRGEFFRRVILAGELPMELRLAFAHLPLNEIDDFFGLGDGVLFGH